MAIVYIHKRKSDNEVFYVGIGKAKKRAYSKHNRSKFWKNYISKYQYNVEITYRDIIWEEACVIEKYLISFYGRRDLGLGLLVNQTDGGDGFVNGKWTNERKFAHSEKMKVKNPYSLPKVIEIIRKKKLGSARLDIVGENNICHRKDVKKKIKDGYQSFINSERGEMYKKDRSYKMTLNNPSKNPTTSKKIKDKLLEKISKLDQNSKNAMTSYMNNKIVLCERCGIQTNIGNYTRWHGIKCKK